MWRKMKTKQKENKTIWNDNIKNITKHGISILNGEGKYEKNVIKIENILKLNKLLKLNKNKLSWVNKWNSYDWN